MSSHKSFIILPLFYLFFFPLGVRSVHTSLCIRLPKGSFPNDKYMGNERVESVGIEKFPQDIWNNYDSPVTRNEGATDNPATPNLEYETDKWVQMRMYTITGAPSREDPLTGWYKIVLTTEISGGFSSGVRSFILYAVDEQLNFVGEFIHEFPYSDQGECHRSSATKHMIIPCGGANKYSPVVSNVVLFAANNSLNNFPEQYQDEWPIVPTSSKSGGLTFYYKISIQDSNRNQMQYINIRLFVDLFPEHIAKEFGGKPTLLTRAVWFRLDQGAVPGAADPLPTNQRAIDCSGKMVSEKALGLTGRHYRDREWSWFHKSFSDQYAFDKQLSKQSIRQANFNHTGCTARFYEGRCLSTHCDSGPSSTQLPHNAQNASIPLIHSTQTATCACKTRTDFCYNDTHDTPKRFNNDVTTFRSIQEVYEDEVSGRTCNMIKDDAMTKQVKVIRRKHRRFISIPGKSNSERFFEAVAKDDLAQRGVRVYGFGTLLYSVRKGHGVLMAIVTFLCIPVAAFVSRFYKESFMETRILYSTVWFQLHLQMVYWMCILYVGGIMLAVFGRQLLGPSLDEAGIVHRVLGWITFGIFVFTAATGGIRVYEEPWRSYSIGLHWALGYFIYFLHLVNIMVSIYIPGSPIAQIDVSFSNHNDPDQSNFMILATLAIWVIFEIIIHVTLRFLLHSYDSWMKVQETRIFLPFWFGVPVPVLKENSRENAPGQGARVVAFWVYIAFSVLTALAVVAQILRDKNAQDVGFGPTACTHKDVGNGSYVMRLHMGPDCFVGVEESAS